MKRHTLRNRGAPLNLSATNVYNLDTRSKSQSKSKLELAMTQTFNGLLSRYSTNLNIRVRPPGVLRL
jgi:hypothetical protein